MVLPFFVTSTRKTLDPIAKQECNDLLTEMYRMLNTSHTYTLKTRTISHSSSVLIGRILCGAPCSPTHCGGTCSVSFYPEDVQTTAFEHLFDEEDTTISWEWSMMVPAYRIFSKQGLRKKDLCHVIRKKQTLNRRPFFPEIKRVFSLCK